MSDERQLQHLTRIIEQGEGPARAWAFRNRVLLQSGYYTSDELINLSLANGFTLSDPLMRVRRGTVISRGAVLLDGSAVEGAAVTLAEGAVLDRAVISGSDVVIGPGTRVTGVFTLDRVMTGAANVIDGLSGVNGGTLSVGANNWIRGVTVQNGRGNAIVIGDGNKLFPGLSVNAPFPGSGVRIGHRNELGRDGGGVVSSSYRFNKEWGGPVLIGSFVETTRGAEILGYSLVGYPVLLLEARVGLTEAALAAAFVEGDLEVLDRVFNRIAETDPVAESPEGRTGKVSLFGTVKTKRCCVCPQSVLKDDTRLLCAYVRDASIPERCKVFYSSLKPAASSALTISAQDVAIVHLDVSEEQDWARLPRTADVDEYPPTDEGHFLQKGSHPGS